MASKINWWCLIKFTFIKWAHVNFFNSQVQSLIMYVYKLGRYIKILLFTNNFSFYTLCNKLVLLTYEGYDI